MDSRLNACSMPFDIETMFADRRSIKSVIHRHFIGHGRANNKIAICFHRLPELMESLSFDNFGAKYCRHRSQLKTRDVFVSEDSIYCD